MAVGLGPPCAGGLARALRSLDEVPDLLSTLVPYLNVKVVAVGSLCSLSSFSASFFYCHLSTFFSSSHRYHQK